MRSLDTNRKAALNISWALVFSTVGLWIAVQLYGRPADRNLTVTRRETNSMVALKAAPNGRCIVDYTEWVKMPEGRQKAVKLAQWKKEYGSLNFHGNCIGEPRHISAAEATQ